MSVREARSKLPHYGEKAYITGAASGIGKALAQMLVDKGMDVFLVDIDDNVSWVADTINTGADFICCNYHTADAADWKSQEKAFRYAVQLWGRFDYVFPIAGIGEKRWLPKCDPKADLKEFEKPDLGVLDVDLTGVLYTVALAVQQFRRQDVDEKGFRGKIACVASVCGYYCAPTLPIYTTAKHGIVGFVRSYGKYLPQENVVMNAVCPNVVKTNISTGAFYDFLDKQDLLTPMKGVMDAFEMLVNQKGKEVSGEIFEVGPNYGKDGQGSSVVKRMPAEYMDEESKKVVDVLEQRGLPLQTPH